MPDLSKPIPRTGRLISWIESLLLVMWCCVICSPTQHCLAQDDQQQDQSQPVDTDSELPLQADQTDEVEGSGTTDNLQTIDRIGTIILETGQSEPVLPVIFKAKSEASAMVSTNRIKQTIRLSVDVVQGDAETISLDLGGDGTVISVTADQLKSWSVRREGSKRFLDLHVREKVKQLSPVISIQSDELRFPAEVNLTHLGPGDAAGFDSTIEIGDEPTVASKVRESEGFVPLQVTGSSHRLQTSLGGKIILAIDRSDAAPAPVELVDASLDGVAHVNGDSIGFQFRATALVNEDDAVLSILSGNAALSELPSDSDFRVRLSEVNNQPVYQLLFEKAGRYTISLDFVASLVTGDGNTKGMDFRIHAGSVIPIKIDGLNQNLKFHPDLESVVPEYRDNHWVGFLPASGRVALRWKSTRESGEGKLFFTTSGIIEAKVGVGLLRQDHQIDYRVLQGELASLGIRLTGPGEILDVQGDHIVSWIVSSKGEQRQLDITLSQPITKQYQIQVRSQTALDAFPVRVEGLRLNPLGAIRHSGFLRLTNLGSVRIEPTGLEGLTQLAPEQYPGDPIEARQTFVYRFPAADHQFAIVADRIQPEVSLSQLVLYQVTESDRVIMADIELDIREAPIREWDFRIPAEYSVVSVTGANVADYVVGSDVSAGLRNLKTMFSQDVSGRQLVSLHLEKSEVASAQSWVLPKITHPAAKAVRGDIGIVGAAGLRVSIEETEFLVDKPLSYFPKPVKGLQQTFRIRQRDWTATTRIELLEKNVQADVFHLYSLNQETVYGSALINYFVTGAPVAQLQITVPSELGNVVVDGQDVRTWRREDDTLTVSLHQPVMGAYTLLVTYEQKPDDESSRFQAGRIVPLGVQGERGYIQVVSPMQVELGTESVTEDLLELDPLELPAEFRLLSTAPPLGTWQYTQRPFDIGLTVNWFRPGTTISQVVEFSEANSRVSQDGEIVTDVLYYVKSRGQRSFKIRLPDAPVRLWDVSVNGQVVTARQTDDATLIPLPSRAEPNVPIEVRLRLGKPTVDESKPQLSLPTVYTPVLKTQWNISGDKKHYLVPTGGTVHPPRPVTRPSGFEWTAKRGLIPLALIALLVTIGNLPEKGVRSLFGGLGNQKRYLTPFKLLALLVAMAVSAGTTVVAASGLGTHVPLQLSLPVLTSGESPEIQVNNVPYWLVDLSWIGVVILLLGSASLIWSLFANQPLHRKLTGLAGLVLVALGILLQGGSAPWFFALLGLAILLFALMSPAKQSVDDFQAWLQRRADEKQKQIENQASQGGASSGDTSAGGTATATGILFAIVLSFPSSLLATEKDGFRAAESIDQQWQISHQDARLRASGRVTLRGKPGDRFVLLKAPAVLTQFDGDGLQLSKVGNIDKGQSYIVSIPTENDASGELPPTKKYAASFEYQLDAVRVTDGVPVLTGIAGLQHIDLSYDRGGWTVSSAAAVRTESTANDDGYTRAELLLAPRNASIVLTPQSRDVETEETLFFVEGFNLYVPGPGVVDGRHRIHIRTAQGRVSELSIQVPKGLTVSDVRGPVGSWQFDADDGRLKVQIEPAQSQNFDLSIDSQRGLSPLPADIELAPLRVERANGEVGLVAIAFGSDAQPEQLEAQGMSAVNLGDFDTSLLPNKQTTLHRVYRYGAEGGTLALRAAAVEPEIRVASQQVLSLGDERVVLAVNFQTEITRAGLFQLSFPLPSGLEVESLSGAALHHWSELAEGDNRQIILHFNGKTIGPQAFSLTLSGPAPTDTSDWQIPRFELNESTRQTGELVVRPTTGIRLRTVSRENVSETDPRSMGGKSQGALAFRLLQRNWNLTLGIEKLDPWLTGQVLHEMTVREGQTRTSVLAEFNVQNASIRKLQIALPLTNESEIKSLRASGAIVGDLVRTDADSNIWELQLKRRVVGKIQFRLEYERRGDREDESESVLPVRFPDARQLTYYLAVRAGGRLELTHDELPDSWQQADWNSFPKTLREMGIRGAPAIALRAVSAATRSADHHETTCTCWCPAIASHQRNLDHDSIPKGKPIIGDRSNHRSDSTKQSASWITFRQRAVQCVCQR